MAEDAEFFKKCLLGTYISSFENDHWLTYWLEVLGFGVFIFCSSFYILDIITLSETTDRKDALPVLGLFILLTASFAVQSHLSVLGIISCPTGSLI